MNLIIDIGNTVAKLAVFEENELIEAFYCDNLRLEKLPQVAERYAPTQAIIATVIELTPEVRRVLNELPCPLLWLDKETPLPIKNLYETPQTLGYDRIAAVVGAQQIHPNRDLLVIDAGTCITYEFLDAAGRYHGGNISPGMEMRFKALHQFTSKLPQVKTEGRLPMLGKDTETAIRSGVRSGIQYEILGYISALKQKYPQLFVFLTGGNDFDFDTNVKNIIFADKFLVLKGLNRILNYNNDKL